MEIFSCQKLVNCQQLVMREVIKKEKCDFWEKRNGKKRDMKEELLKATSVRVSVDLIFVTDEVFFTINCNNCSLNKVKYYQIFRVFGAKRILPRSLILKNFVLM